MSVSDAEALASVKHLQPSLRDKFDAVAVALHAQFLREGFSLAALSESDDDAKAVQPLPSRWNASGDGYCFCYRKGELRVVTKMVRMGARLVVHASRRTPDARVLTMTVRVSDHILQKTAFSPGALDAMYVKIGVLVSDFSRLIVRPLEAKSSPAKAGSTVASEAGSSAKATDGKSRSGTGASSAAAIGTRPRPTPEQPRGGPQRPIPQPGPSPLIDPRFRNPRRPAPARPSFNPFAPDNLLVGPRNPGFRGRGRGGIPRGPGRIPGARFDPFGPFGGRGRGAFGEPDADHLRFPGPGRGGFGFDDEDII